LIQVGSIVLGQLGGSSLIALARLVAEAGNDVAERFAQAVIDVLKANVDQHAVHDVTASLDFCRGFELAEKAVAALFQTCPNMTKDEFVAVISEKWGLQDLVAHDLWQKPSTPCSKVLADAGKGGSVSVEQALVALHVLSTHDVFFKEDVDALEWFFRRVHIEDKPSSVDEMMLSQIGSQISDLQFFRDLVSSKVAPNLDFGSLMDLLDAKLLNLKSSEKNLQFADNLVTLYSDFKFEDGDLSRLKMDSRFFELKLKDWNKEDQAEALKGSDQMFHWVNEVDFSKFWNYTPRRRVVVRGAAGSGKSTLLRWIARQWAKGKLWNDKFEAVVFLDLKNVQHDAESLVDVLGSVLFNGDKKMEEPVRAFLSWTKDHRVLWLLDRLDEVEVKDGTALWKIQKGLPVDEGRVEFMMAEAGKNWLQVEKDTILMVEGFTNAGIWRFVRRYFNEWNGYDASLTLLLCMKRVYKGWLRDLQRKIAEPLLGMRVEERHLTRLIRKLLRHDWMLEACRLPLMLRLVCSVAPQLANMERVNRTTLYKLMVDRFMDRVEPELRRKVREQLAEIAWTGFSSRVESIRCFEQMARCGLLNSEMECSWLHFSFRDYLAAEHICSDRFKGDLVTELKRCLGLKNRDAFFGFVCGIGGKAVDCAMEWYPKDLKLYPWGDLKDSGPVIWIEEGGKRLEEVVATLWKDLFEQFGGILLRVAAHEGFVNMVKFLTRQKIDVNAADDSGWTALIYASEKGDLEIVQHLIEHGANVIAASDFGYTALLVASGNGHLEVVKCLIEHGAVLQQNDENLNAWDIANRKGHTEVMRLLEARFGPQK